ncbi:MAG: hypothetical protein HY817_04155 [Candidatus Abawacabacteria bacterium]|nr:hypothetical protein [Candidatus Abawacabacteria bacterium]
MEKICKITGKPFTISKAEQEYCRSNDLPLPTIAPYERLRQMFYFYNPSFLYNGICSFSGKPMLSIVPPDKGFKVYDIGTWMDDTAWDPMSYGRDFDFSRPFFAQFAELMKEVPIPSRSVVLSTMENSDYTNGVSQVKNCYLIFDCDVGEDCYFSYQMQRVKNIIDSINVRDSELCYGCKHIKDCYNLRFCENCVHCSDATFLFNCRNVRNSYGSTNLSNKEYCWFNEQLTKEEFEIRSAKLNLGSRKELTRAREEFEIFKKAAFLKAVNGQSNENCSGDYLNECKKCTDTFFSTQAEDCEYCVQANGGKNCYFYTTFGNNVELVYNSAVCGHNVYNVKFCLGSFVNVRDLEYCMHVGFGANNCFGCIGLRKKQYCIFNKQYPKEAYFELLKRIKNHMVLTGEYGQFFPSELSPFHYNKSEASLFFPLTREEALARELSWEDEIIEEFSTDYIIPDDIREVPDSILEQTLKCSVSGKKYRIIKQELALYRHWQVPIPLIAPLERIKISCQALRLQTIIERPCSHCHKSIRTAYNNPEQSVLCEECYSKAMI